MASSGLIAIAAAIAIAVSTLGPAIAQGITAGKAMDAIARQPEAAGNIRSTLIVALGMIEALTIYGWTVINFFLLLFLLNRFLYKPVISFMEQRQARIDAKLREEEEAKARIEENDARILDEKARSREEAKKLLALNAEEIEKHNAEVLQEAKKASVQNRKDSEAALSQRQEKTAQQLHEAAPELAAMLAEKLLSEE